MPFASPKTISPIADVPKDLKVIPLPVVSPLVAEPIRNAHWIVLVATEIASIHANQILVEPMLNVWFQIICINVDVCLVIPGIHTGLAFHLPCRNAWKTKIVQRTKFVWTKNVSILAWNWRLVWHHPPVDSWIPCLFEQWFANVRMVTSRMIKEVVEPCHPSFLDAKETTNAVNPLPVSMRFVKILAVVDSMPNATLSTIAPFAFVILDSTATRKWLVSP
jgi:hypothetical protein